MALACLTMVCLRPHRSREGVERFASMALGDGRLVAEQPFMWLLAARGRLHAARGSSPEHRDCGSELRSAPRQPAEARQHRA